MLFSATETYSTSDMSQMDTEYQELELEVVRIVEQTKWNTISVLDEVEELVVSVHLLFKLVQIMHKV